MPKVTVELGDQLFEFKTFGDWVNKAQSRYGTICGVKKEDTIAIDNAGRVCAKGLEMMRARDEQTFPVRIYKKLC